MCARALLKADTSTAPSLRGLRQPSEAPQDNATLIGRNRSASTESSWQTSRPPAAANTTTSARKQRSGVGCCARGESSPRSSRSSRPRASTAPRTKTSTPRSSTATAVAPPTPQSPPSSRANAPGRARPPVGGSAYLKNLNTTAAATGISTQAAETVCALAPPSTSTPSPTRPTTTAEALADTAQAEILAATAVRAGLHPSVSLNEVRENVLDEIELIGSKQEHQVCTGVPTGFRELDELTGGPQPGELVVIAGHPAMGTTTLAVDFLRTAVLTHRLPAVMFTRDASLNDIGMRLLAAERAIPPVPPLGAPQVRPSTLRRPAPPVNCWGRAQRSSYGAEAASGRRTPGRLAATRRAVRPRREALLPPGLRLQSLKSSPAGLGTISSPSRSYLEATPNGTPGQRLKP